MKTFCLSLCMVILLAGCGREKPDDNGTIQSISSAAVQTPVTTAPVVEEISIPDSLVAKVNNQLTGADTLFNVMARQKLLAGKFDTLTLISEAFLDVDDMNGNWKLTAALIGSFHETEYSTVEHTVLAVFDQSNNMSLVSFIRFGDMEDREGLVTQDLKAQSLDMVSGKEAAELHFLYAEEGAGDHSSHSDNVSIYALVGGNLTEIFTYAAETFDFVSNETSAWYQVIVTSTATLTDLKKDEMPGIELVIVKDETGYEEQEEEEEQQQETEETTDAQDGQPEEIESNDDETQQLETQEDPRERTESYAFDGTVYVKKS